MDDRIVGELRPVPAPVAVHRVVAAAHGPDSPCIAKPALELLEISHPGGGQRVATVGERVDDQIRYALLSGQLDARLEVLPAGVNPSVGYQPHQVQAPAGAGAGRLADCLQRGVLEEAAVGDRVVDPGQVLLDYRSGAEVEVADLGVAHLAVGEADVAPAGGERRVRVALPEAVE